MSEALRERWRTRLAQMGPENLWEALVDESDRAGILPRVNDPDRAKMMDAGWDFLYLIYDEIRDRLERQWRAGR